MYVKSPDLPELFLCWFLESVVTQSDFRIKMAALALIGREIYYFLSRTNTCRVPDLPEIFCRG